MQRNLGKQSRNYTEPGFNFIFNIFLYLFVTSSVTFWFWRLILRGAALLSLGTKLHRGGFNAPVLCRKGENQAR